MNFSLLDDFKVHLDRNQHHVFFYELDTSETSINGTLSKDVVSTFFLVQQENKLSFFGIKNKTNI